MHKIRIILGVVRICSSEIFELLNFVGTCVRLALQIAHVHTSTGNPPRVWYHNIDCGVSLVRRSTDRRWHARLYQFWQKVPPIFNASWHQWRPQNKLLKITKHFQHAQIKQGYDSPTFQQWRQMLLRVVDDTNKILGAIHVETVASICSMS